MPDVSVFIDSNVFLYARDIDGGSKEIRTNEWLRALISAGVGRTNLQVLNEVTSVLLRKRRDLQPSSIFTEVDGLSFLGATPLNIVTVQTARTVHHRHGFSWWDSLLLASAINLGCTHFLSEDLQDEQAIEGLTIISPFAHTPQQILSSE